MLMVMYMKENGRMTRLMVTESTCTQMELNTRVLGKKTNSMEKERKLGLMVHVILEIMWKEKKMEMVNSSGLMNQLMMVSSRIIIFMAKAFMYGQIKGGMRVNG